MASKRDAINWLIHNEDLTFLDDDDSMTVACACVRDVFFEGDEGWFLRELRKEAATINRQRAKSKARGG